MLISTDWSVHSMIIFDQQVKSTLCLQRIQGDISGFLTVAAKITLIQQQLWGVIELFPREILVISCELLQFRKDGRKESLVTKAGKVCRTERMATLQLLLSFQFLRDEVHRVGSWIDGCREAWRSSSVRHHRKHDFALELYAYANLVKLRALQHVCKGSGFLTSSLQYRRTFLSNQ